MEPEPPTTEMDAFGAEASEELDIDAERIAGALLGKHKRNGR